CLFRYPRTARSTSAPFESHSLRVSHMPRSKCWSDVQQRACQALAPCKCRIHNERDVFFGSGATRVAAVGWVFPDPVVLPEVRLFYSMFLQQLAQLPALGARQPRRLGHIARGPLHQRGQIGSLETLDGIQLCLIEAAVRKIRGLMGTRGVSDQQRLNRGEI